MFFLELVTYSVLSVGIPFILVGIYQELIGKKNLPTRQEIFVEKWSDMSTPAKDIVLIRSLIREMGPSVTLNDAHLTWLNGKPIIAVKVPSGTGREFQVLLQKHRLRTPVQIRETPG